MRPRPTGDLVANGGRKRRIVRAAYENQPASAVAQQSRALPCIDQLPIVFAFAQDAERTDDKVVGWNAELLAREQTIDMLWQAPQVRHHRPVVTCASAIV